MAETGLDHIKQAFYQDPPTEVASPNAMLSTVWLSQDWPSCDRSQYLGPIAGFSFGSGYC